MFQGTVVHVSQQCQAEHIGRAGDVPSMSLVTRDSVSLSVTGQQSQTLTAGESHREQQLRYLSLQGVGGTGSHLVVCFYFLTSYLYVQEQSSPEIHFHLKKKKTKKNS